MYPLLQAPSQWSRAFLFSRVAADGTPRVNSFHTDPKRFDTASVRELKIVRASELSRSIMPLHILQNISSIEFSVYLQRGHV